MLGGRLLTAVKLCDAMCCRCIGPAWLPHTCLLASEHLINLKGIQSGYMLRGACCAQEQRCVHDSWAHSPVIAHKMSKTIEQNGARKSPASTQSRKDGSGSVIVSPTGAIARNEGLTLVYAGVLTLF